MTQTEALKLALEALKNSQYRFAEYGYQAMQKTIDGNKEAITAIKAALEAKDEPVPVAIVEVFGKDWRLDYMALPVGKHKLYAQQYTYTTLSQRKPLTDEEIDKAWRSVDYTVPWDQHRIDIARAIEAAHGIKE